MAGPGKEAPASGKDRPLYEIVRDQLIEEIKSGAYPAGALLPSVREITVKWTVSTTTARKVLAELVSAGYARSEGTRGHVSMGSTPVRTSGATSDTDPGMPTALTIRTSQVVPVRGVLQAVASAVDVRLERPPAEVVLALHLDDPQAPLVVRRTLAMDSKGVPIQARISYTIRQLAEGTRLAESDVIDGPWLEALREHTGQHMELSESYVSARHPTDSEAAMLALALTACVLVRVDSTRDSHGRMVDYTTTIWPGETTRIAII